MAYDITVKHPAYVQFLPAWKLMRDTFDGEECVKAAGECYLPMKSGTAAIKDERKQKQAYEAYKLRAEFPELVAPTVRGSVGIMLKQSASIELPKSMEFLRTNATRDGLTLEAFHRRIAVEMMLMGRYGVLPGIDPKSNLPYLAGYTAESIINWDDPTATLTTWCSMNPARCATLRRVNGRPFANTANVRSPMVNTHRVSGRKPQTFRYNRCCRGGYASTEAIGFHAFCVLSGRTI